MPDRLGAFAILGVLGRGGSGIVYAAESNGQRVALKVLRDDLLATERDRERFLNEAALLQTIEHAHVVKIVGTGTLPDGRPFLAMELLDGETLAVRVARGPLALGEALALFAQLADAVATLHDRKLVHRDIKPENVVVETGRAVLLDFGIAKPESAAASTITQDGAVRGTPAYMAPERFFGAPATVASDVYELAVTLYVMVTARLPWDSAADPAARLNPPRPSELGFPLPAAVETAIAAALSSRAETRPASARELAKRVREAADLNATTPARTTEQLGPRPAVADATGPHAPQPRPAATTATLRSSRRRVVVVVAIAAIAAAAIAAFALRRHDASSQATLDPARDPWADHPAAVAADEPAPVTEEPVPVAAVLPGALQAQIDLHPAESNVLLAISGSKLRASAAMKAATKGATQLAELNARCGFDLLATVDVLLIGGTLHGSDLVFDISARGRFANGAAEHCIAGVLGAAASAVTRDGAATRIEGAGHVVWVSHPDASTVFVTMRADGNHLASTRDHGVRRGQLAPLLAMVDVDSAAWLVGQPQANTIELFPGVASPQSLFGAANVTDTIELRGGLRFADSATTATATRALRAKLDELMTDPIARSVLGNAKLSANGRDTVFTASISDAFAAITLQSVFKYLGD